MTQALKLIPLLAALAAAPAFAQPEPHHPDAQASAPPAAAETPSPKTDMGHGCPMAGHHMMAGGHMGGGGQMMSGAGGAHCMDGHAAPRHARHARRHRHSHAAAPKPSK